MLAELRRALKESEDLNANFDTYIVDYKGSGKTFYLDLKNDFGEKLWQRYIQLADFLHQVYAAKYQDVNITVDVLNKIKDIKHQVFLTFRRLIGLSYVKDNGPCPLCLQQCNKNTNPRASSHVIADAAIRAIIAQFDERMDRSIAFFQQGVLVKGKNGPSSIKWKMLCRECEQFVCDSGEERFTVLLKDALHAKDVPREIPDAHWRFDFAATLLWRTMHVVQPFANCADVSAMYPLYDEFNVKMSNARKSLAENRPITDHPLIAIQESDFKSECDKGGIKLGLFYGNSPTFDKDCGYVHAQIWKFHFFGFFNEKSLSHLSDAGKEQSWSTIVQCEEERMKEENKTHRESASQDDIKRFLDRCTVIRDVTTKMTKFKVQPAIPVGIIPVQIPLIKAEYYSVSEIVTYKEFFSGEDKFFGTGFDLVFEKSKFEDENVLVANFLSLVVDLHGYIKKWLDENT